MAVSAALYATFLPSRLSTRADGLNDAAVGLTTSAAVSVQRQQETVSAATANATTGDAQTGGGASANLSSNTTGAAAQATVGPAIASNALRTLLPGSTPSPNPNAAVSPDASPTPSPTPESATNVPCEASDSPLYCVYTVVAGDNLGTIAVKFNIKGNDELTPWEFLVQSNRPDIVSEDDLLQLGQKLRIPLYSGVVHTVLSSQTLGEIADRYGVDPEDIMGVAANGISNPNAITIGTDLIIPNPTRLSAPVMAVATTPLDIDDDDDDDLDSDVGSGGSNALGSTPNTGPRSSSGFMWPTTGPISSYYGPSHPLGIDIDLFSNPNASIGAAAGGVVTFAGGNACCSYGYYVIVDHGNGIQTLYAHLSTILVSVGESVSAGEILGYGGSTGYSTGNHLHFEVHVGGGISNPLEYLP